MNSLLLLFTLVYPFLCWAASADDYVVLEPLITPEFLKEMNPVIMNSLNQTLTDLNLSIPPQNIPLWFLKPIHVDIKKVQIKDIQWSNVSGLYFTEDAFGFRAVMDMGLYADYETNSRFLLPSSGINATIKYSADIALSFDYDPVQHILKHKFKNEKVMFEQLDIKATRGFLISMFSTLSQKLNPLIRSLLSFEVIAQLQVLMPTIMTSISKVEFEVPFVGTYHTEFTQAPIISKKGILVDMALFEGSVNSTEHVPVDKLMDRIFGEPKRLKTRSLNYYRKTPSPDTAIQPLLTPTFFKQVTPIFMNAAKTFLTLNPKEKNASFPINQALLPKFTLNVTSVEMTHIEWMPDTKVSLGKDVIDIKMGLSLRANIAFVSDSSILKKGNLIVNLNRFTVSSSVGFEQESDSRSWNPLIKNLNVSIQKIQILKSPIPGLNIITSIFNPVITMLASYAVKDALKGALPQVIQDALQSEFEIPFMGIFHSEFLSPPDISPDGMMVEMDIVPGKRPVRSRSTVEPILKTQEEESEKDSDTFPGWNVLDFLDE